MRINSKWKERGKFKFNCHKKHVNYKKWLVIKPVCINITTVAHLLLITIFVIRQNAHFLKGLAMNHSQLQWNFFSLVLKIGFKFYCSLTNSKNCVKFSVDL